ncbi:MAG: AsmA family protein [Wenzhouxiangella sp.]
MARKLLYLFAAAVVLLLSAVVVIVVFVDADDYRDQIAERASSALGREVTLHGPVRLRLLPRLALEVHDLRVANPPALADAPALAEVGRASLTVAVWPLLGGQLEIGQVSLRDASLALVSTPAGLSNLDGLLADTGSAEPTETPPDLSRVSLAGLKLENISLQAIELGADADLHARIDALTLGAFRPGQRAPVSVQGRVLDGAQASLAELALSAELQVASDGSRVMLHGADAEFRLASLTGQARAEVDLDLANAAPVLELQGLTTALELDGQSLNLAAAEPLVIRLADPLTARLAGLEMAINGQPLKVSGELSAGAVMAADLTVSGAELDMRPWLSAATPVDQAQKPAAEPAPDFSALIGPRLGLRLALDRLVMDDDLVLEQIDAQAQLEDGLLHLDPLIAEGLGGRFSGLVTVDFNAAPPQVRLSPRLSELDVQQLLGLFSPAAPLRGLGEMNVDLAFSGLSAPEILASLDGEGRFSIDDGALLGVDLKRLIEEEMTTSNLSSIQRAFGGETPFRALSGRIEARSGVLSLPELRLQADGFDLTGTGSLDLTAAEVAYQLELDLGSALVERLPSVLARATAGVIPLTIAGPIQRPVVQVDLAALAEGALQRELQDRLFDRLAPEPPEAEDGEAPEQQERTSELLLRALRDRRRDDEPPPTEPPAS